MVIVYFFFPTSPSQLFPSYSFLITCLWSFLYPYFQSPLTDTGSSSELRRKIMGLTYAAMSLLLISSCEAGVLCSHRPPLAFLFSASCVSCCNMHYRAYLLLLMPQLCQPPPDQVSIIQRPTPLLAPVLIPSLPSSLTHCPLSLTCSLIPFFSLSLPPSLTHRCTLCLAIPNQREK
jgi:hypothetical protein